MAFAIKPFLSYLSQPTTALTTVCIQLSDYYVPPYAYESDLHSQIENFV